MEVRLKVVSGSHAGKQIRLNKAEFLIGRAEECHLRANSDLVSRRHCAILSNASQVVVKDFGSRNGTKVNGTLIEGQQPLQTGDHLQVGPLEFEVHLAHGLGGPKRSAVKDVADAAARTAQPQANVEDSICDWLGEPTGTLGHLSTTSIRTKPSEADTDVADDSAVSSEPESDATESAEQPPSPAESGKLPKIEKPRAKDSREAAANILRELSRRR